MSGSSCSALAPNTASKASLQNGVSYAAPGEPCGICGEVTMERYPCKSAHPCCIACRRDMTFFKQRCPGCNLEPFEGTCDISASHDPFFLEQGRSDTQMDAEWTQWKEAYDFVTKLEADKYKYDMADRATRSIHVDEKKERVRLVQDAFATVNRRLASQVSSTSENTSSSSHGDDISQLVCSEVDAHNEAQVAREREAVQAMASLGFEKATAMAREQYEAAEHDVTQGMEPGATIPVRIDSPAVDGCVVAFKCGNCDQIHVRQTGLGGPRTHCRLTAGPDKGQPVAVPFDASDPWYYATSAIAPAKKVFTFSQQSHSRGQGASASAEAVNHFDWRKWQEILFLNESQYWEEHPDWEVELAVEMSHGKTIEDIRQKVEEERLSQEEARRRRDEAH
uniref:Uncharacterized protein n=1 Tax=Haptolina brevifila TaxID=156173 RepID=A0A7S2BV84_9EUKA|mmetsp:Transcript_17048/g.34502  ORF Transcript_17048/g.34502 Transcript_17048/m.34502 type:complete len:394 (+) Transcript_17048:67-1248(+)